MIKTHKYLKIAYEYVKILIGYFFRPNNNLKGDNVMKRTVVITSAVVGGILTVCGTAYVVLKKTGKLEEIKEEILEEKFDLDELLDV